MYNDLLTLGNNFVGNNSINAGTALPALGTFQFFNYNQNSNLADPLYGVAFPIGYTTPSQIYKVPQFLDLPVTPSNTIPLTNTEGSILWGNENPYFSLGTISDEKVKSSISYLWSINNKVPLNELQDKIVFFENKYKMPSEEFYTKWLDGEIEANSETKEWINLYSFIL